LSTTTGFDEAEVSQRVIHAYGILYLVESSLKLRSNVKLTLHCYTHSVSEDRMAAGAMLTAIFSHAADRSGLKAEWEGKTRFR
jgi:hypothetical protein